MMLAACVDNLQNENVLPDESDALITETISARVNEGGTKATIDGTSGAFAWTKDNDAIAVHTTGDGSHAACYVTSGGASASAAEAGFTVSYYGSRDAFAIYPSNIVATDAANYGQEGHALDVTLPASYTLAEVSGEASPCPMIASNTGTNWEFKQLCGLLRLTVNNIPSDATGMVIQFPGKKVNGSFSIASPVSPGFSTIPTGVAADGEDKITISFDAGITSAIVNIPLPTGTYDYLYITPVGTSTKVAAIRNVNNITAGPYTAVRANGKKLTTTMVSFSVSSTKKVFFAPGNLVKIGGSTYAFETTPFNTNGGSLGYNQGDWESLPARGYFSWSEIATANEEPRLFTINGVSDWKAMTFDEWNFLYAELYESINTGEDCYGRTMEDGVARYYRVYVGGPEPQLGLLITPDEATSSDVTGLTDKSVTEIANIDTFISKGFAFLPSSGYFSRGVSDTWGDAGIMGYYWYTTEDEADEDLAYYLRFHSTGPNGMSDSGTDWKSNYYYISVRLVHEYK